MPRQPNVRLALLVRHGSGFGDNMAFFPHKGYVIDASSGVLLLVLGVVVAWARPGHRIQTAFATFAIGFGLLLTFGNLVSADDPLFLPFQHASAVFALLVAGGLLLVAWWFPTVPAPGVRTEILVAAVVSFVAGLVFVFVLMDNRPSLLGTGWMNMTESLSFLQFFFYFCLVTMAVRALHVPRDEPKLVAQFAVATAGLALWPGIFTGSRLAYSGAAYYEAMSPFWWWAGHWETQYALFVTFGVLFHVFLAAAWFVLARRTSTHRKAFNALALGLVVWPFLGGWLITLIIIVDGTHGLNGAVRMVSVLVFAYGILRRHLFDLDVKIRFALEHGLFAVALFLGFFATGGVAATFGTRSPTWVFGLVAVGFLLVFYKPIHHVTRRLAGAVMANTAVSTGDLNLRRVEVYRAAVQDALARPDYRSLASDASLAKLRTHLSLTERDHALILHGIQEGAQRSMPPHMPAEGSLVAGKYRIGQVLGEGSQGRTFRATDIRTDAPVVVKWITRPDPESPTREIDVLRRISHPNVVRLLDVVKDDAVRALVLEYLAGGSLAARLQGPLMDDAAFLRLARELLAAISAVHHERIVHRDIKPSNVLFDEQGSAKLSDFGVAHARGKETTVGFAGPSTAAIGTIRYMSPEQAKGKSPTVESDLFSAAATLFEAWSGEMWLDAHDSESPIELQMRAASAGAFARRVRGPRRLREWFRQALEPSPRDRFHSADEMAVALETAFNAPGRPARTPTTTCRRRSRPQA